MQITTPEPGAYAQDPWFIGGTRQTDLVRFSMGKAPTGAYSKISGGVPRTRPQEARAVPGRDAERRACMSPCVAIRSGGRVLQHLTPLSQDLTPLPTASFLNCSMLNGLRNGEEYRRHSWFNLSDGFEPSYLSYLGATCWNEQLHTRAHRNDKRLDFASRVE
jgi:hypothetical protein